MISDKNSESQIQDRLAGAYESCRYGTAASRRYHEAVTEIMLRGIPVGGVILDNGCGTGQFTPASESAFGVDISKQMTCRATQRNIQVARADSLLLPFRSETFDLVIARSLLHHVPDLDRCINETWRVLKYGGTAVMLDTNKSLLSVLPRRIAYRGSQFASSHENLSWARLDRALRRRLGIEQHRPVGFVAYPLVGFPDILDFSRYFERRLWIVDLLVTLDECLSRLPLSRLAAWGQIVVCRKIPN